MAKIVATPATATMVYSVQLIPPPSFWEPPVWGPRAVFGTRAIVFPLATSFVRPLPSFTSNVPSLEVITTVPSAIATSPKVLNPGAGSTVTVPTCTLTAAWLSGWNSDTLPAVSTTVTALSLRRNLAAVSRPNTTRPPLPSATTAAPSFTCRLSPLNNVVLGNNACPPKLAFILPATDPTTSEPANIGTEADIPTRSTIKEMRNRMDMFLVSFLCWGDDHLRPAPAVCTLTINFLTKAPASLWHI